MSMEVAVSVRHSQRDVCWLSCQGMSAGSQWTHLSSMGCMYGCCNASSAVMRVTGLKSSNLHIVFETIYELLQLISGSRMTTVLTYSDQSRSIMMMS